MIVRCIIDVGGALPVSAANAVQESFFDVARIRADPLNPGVPPTFELITIPAAKLVPKIRVAPGGMLMDVATTLLEGAPPLPGKISTPTCIDAVCSSDVQPKYVAVPKPCITLGTV